MELLKIQELVLKAVAKHEEMKQEKTMEVVAKDEQMKQEMKLENDTTNQQTEHVREMQVENFGCRMKYLPDIFMQRQMQLEGKIGMLVDQLEEPST